MRLSILLVAKKSIDHPILYNDKQLLEEAEHDIKQLLDVADMISRIIQTEVNVI